MPVSRMTSAFTPSPHRSLTIPVVFSVLVLALLQIRQSASLLPSNTIAATARSRGATIIRTALPPAHESTPATEYDGRSNLPNSPVPNIGDHHRRKRRHIPRPANDPTAHSTTENRRDTILRHTRTLFLLVTSTTPLSPFFPHPAHAKAVRRTPLPNPPKKKIDNRTGLEAVQEACQTLQSLLDNWERATIDCAYADVPRNLLESKNKEELLERASTFALFEKGDESVAVSCRRTNRLVRDYIGVTGKGPLVGIEKRLLGREKGGVVDMLDPDLLEEYYNEVESFSQSLSRASSLSYTAGMSDLNSVNNFAKDQDPNASPPPPSLPTTAVKTADTASTVQNPEDSNLEQARGAIVDAKRSIDRVLKLMGGASAVGAGV